MSSQVVLRWPDHWYFDENHIRCIVPNCSFNTPATVMMYQWHELHVHCKDTPGTEHEILDKMLHQSNCAVDDCDYSASSNAHFRIRDLFAHEKSAHGSTDMFNICSFVRLAREGRIRGGRHGKPERECEKLAFDRMLEKVLALPDETKNVLFQRSGFHDPKQKTPQNMGQILTADHLAQQDDEPPYWWPIRAEHFLWLIRPNLNDPADHQWRMVWTGLREEYANGRL